MLLSFEQGILAVVIATVVLMVLTSFAKSTGSGPHGGKIGEPDHEVTIVPAEEPVPKPTPVPPTTPVREPVPQRSTQ